jgi:hypothetical protein
MKNHLIKNHPMKNHLIKNHPMKNHPIRQAKLKQIVTILMNGEYTFKIQMLETMEQPYSCVERFLLLVLQYLLVILYGPAKGQFSILPMICA